MSEPETDLPPEPSPHDGWEMVCDGILRTGFGRRPSRALSNTILQLAVEEALHQKPARPAALFSFFERIQNWRRIFSTPKFAFGVASFLAIGAAVLLWRPGWAGHKTAPGKMPICTLSGASEARWAGGSAHPKIGDALSEEDFRLASGVVELTFASTAKVAMEGPAEFKVTGLNSFELVSGKISTDVPKHAKGFAMKTPAATMVDLGTRFGALVNFGHASEVDVFQGRVELTADAGGRWRLTQGMAMIADSHGAVAADALPEDAFPQPSQIVLARPQNCGFDVPARAAIGGVPADFGYWSGSAYELIGPSQEIQPSEGAGMLRFLPKNSGPPGDSEVWQLVDLHSFKKLLAGGRVEAMLSSEFNRVEGDARRGDKFGLTLAAFHGVPADAKSLWSERKTAALALADKELTADNNPATWEKIEVSARLPAETDFVIVEIRAIAPKEIPSDAPLFPGHFADRVDLQLYTPLQPSAIATGR